MIPDSHDIGPPQRQPRPFQYTLRTLLLVVTLVSVFCSAAVTFQGLARLFAMVLLAWLTIGYLYVKHRAYRPMLLPHSLVPILLMVGAWLVLPSGLTLGVATVGMTAGIAYSAGFALEFRLDERRRG